MGGGAGGWLERFFSNSLQNWISSLEHPPTGLVDQQAAAANQEAASAGTALIKQSRDVRGSLHHANCLAAITKLYKAAAFKHYGDLFELDKGGPATALPALPNLR